MDSVLKPKLANKEQDTKVRNMAIALGWSNMNSAPKDGTRVLLTDGNHMCTAHWSWDTDGYDENDECVMSKTDGCWMVGFSYQMFPDPIAWMDNPLA